MSQGVFLLASRCFWGHGRYRRRVTDVESAYAPRKDTEKMHRFVLFCVVFLAGCQNLVGPFQARPPQRVDDPLLSIGEQQRRGRNDLALPEDTSALAPKIYIDRPGTTGR